MWRPTKYSDDDFAEFREAVAGLADRLGDDPCRLPDQLRQQGARDPQPSRSPRSPTRCASATESAPHGVVLHAGARKGEPHGPSMKRAAKAIAAALADSESCPMLLENTAGTQGPLGRDFDELGELVELLDGDARVGICLDSCHLLASGFEIRTREALDAVIDEFDAKVGLDRLHLPAPQRLEDPARRQPRPPRHPRRGRDRRARAGASFSPSRASTQLPTLIETGGDGRRAGRRRRRARAQAAQARHRRPPSRRAASKR